jgi:hypothetical protein
MTGVSLSPAKFSLFAVATSAAPSMYGAVEVRIAVAATSQRSAFSTPDAYLLRVSTRPTLYSP